MATVDLTIQVLDLSPNVTRADLINFFSYCGTIDKIELTRTADEPKCATVTFRQPYAQQTALLLNNATIRDCPVRILPDKGKLNYETQDEKQGLGKVESVASAYFTSGVLWISGVLDKASKCTAELAIASKERERNSRKQK